MKPPPRKRTKRTVYSFPEPVTTTKVDLKWKRGEQRKLLYALKRLWKNEGGNSEINYATLKKSVPTRSASEIQSFVESLKDKVISSVSIELKKKDLEDKKAAKPIELWTEMASSIAGKHEAMIFAAFSQMLTVASTEPDTLRHCDPPQVYRPPSDESRPVGRTVPFRPLPRSPVQAKLPGTSTSSPLVVKTQDATKGPIIALQTPTQVVSEQNIKQVPPQQQPSTITLSLPAATSKQLDVAEVVTEPYSASQIVKPVTSPGTPNCSCTAVGETQEKDSFTHLQPGSLCSSCTSKLPSCGPQTSPCSLVTNITPGFSTTATSTVPSSTTIAPASSTATSTVASSTTFAPGFTTATPTVPSSTTITPASSTATSTVPSSSFTTSTCSDTSSAPPLSTPATPLHDKCGRTSKCASEDIPRTFGVKFIVDFEKIYHFLSVISKPNMDCQLTPMESAIVLDLLMSLPEEVPLLDCDELQKHFVQVYRCLSAPADSKISRERLKNLRDSLSGQTDAQAGASSARPDTDSGGETLQANEAEHQGASGGNNADNQPGEADLMEPWPLLNPFLVPLKLLKRK
ncbi:snRNA-activating protein complex subunit 2 [Betta splendens]|uniref:snRNA-activating protein complex subunit 2 n=1 Tax=Betta splendens TaxID=158456 RepID=A0A6P7LNC6_BETSP|nr:snRNA-activating protein complex subunit 2 [Betta splendens]